MRSGKSRSEPGYLINGLIAICPHVSKCRFSGLERGCRGDRADIGHGGVGGSPTARGALADKAHELLFDDYAGHALHFGEATGEGGGGLVQRDGLLPGLFG